MSFPQLKSKIISLSSKLSNTLALYTSSDNENQQHELKSKIELQLSNLSSLINDLSRLIDNDTSSAKFQQLIRFKDELKRHRMDFQRISAQLTEKFNRSNLLSDSPSENLQDLNSADYMLDEQLRAQNQHNILDSLITQVLSTRDEMFRQQSVLSNVQTNLDNSLQSIPGLNIILSKIDARHRKQAYILTFVVLICLIILWFSL